MTTEKKARGFATLSPERRREISSRGGKAAHATGKGHQFTSAEAKAAGRKGGLAAHKSRGPQRSAVEKIHENAEMMMMSGPPHLVSGSATDAQIAASDNRVIRENHLVNVTNRVERDEMGMPMRLYPESIQAKA